MEHWNLSQFVHRYFGGYKTMSMTKTCRGEYVFEGGGKFVIIYARTGVEARSRIAHYVRHITD